MNEPTWTAENINKKSGSTTFKTCGWCEYTTCGSVRYNCKIESTCDLLVYNDKVTWNTPCKVKNLGKTDLDNLISQKRYNISNLKEQSKRAEKEIAVIEKLRKSSEDTPPLPHNRIEDFKIGETVYVFLPIGERVPKTKWYRGVVVNGYRSGDGCVSYVLDELPKSQGGWGCGVNVPSILKEKEYEFFKKNPEKFKIWVNSCDISYNGEKIINEGFMKL